MTLALEHKRIVEASKITVTAINEHTIRVAKLLGHGVDTKLIAERANTAMRYKLTVSPSIIEKFKYHASIRGGTPRYAVSGGLFNTGHISSIVKYISDIPDFALDKIEEATQDFANITIHSNVQLPHETIRQTVVYRYPMIDPVVIGWERSPVILLRGKIKDGVLIKPQIAAYNKDTIGYVIAIWDEEGNPI